MFIIRIASSFINSFTWYRKGSTWTSERSRASTYETREAAQEALDRARPYTKPKDWKRATIEEA